MNKNTLANKLISENNNIEDNNDKYNGGGVSGRDQDNEEVKENLKMKLAQGTGWDRRS